MLGVITALGKDLADFYKVKHPPTFYPPFLGVYPREMKTCPEKTCSRVRIGTLFIIAQSWKQSTCPPAEELINKLCCY